MSEDHYIGPSALEPGAPVSGDRLARILLIPLFVAFLAFLLIFYILFTTTSVNGESMLPTLRNGDKLLLTKSYPEPHHGDVIVFEVLDENNDEEGLIKRVVALPGDTVEIRQGIALVNGVVEGTRSMITSVSDSSYRPPVVVPPEHVYVLGDNRPIALDSRDLGPIPLGSVRGRVAYVFAPASRITRVR